MASNRTTRNKTGDVIGEWTLEEHIGSGGNGDVWKAARAGYQPHAIKILRDMGAESYARFKAETDVLDKLGSLAGIVPLVEKNVPEDRASRQVPWFVMPLAVPFEAYVSGKTAEQIVRDFLPVGETLAVLHGQNISHRDIKPANLLYLDGRLCLSDFGLVKYPERLGLTPEKRDIGAKFTMAPEMRRQASVADGLPADVYSFAKSLWIALTGNELGFDGQYSAQSTLALGNYMQKSYTTTLDQILVECTESDPGKRPTILPVLDRMKEWLELTQDFGARNLAEWRELGHKLFPLSAPAQAAWYGIDEICAVLAEVVRIPALHHMFFPTGGGHTITGVARAPEPEMIELRVGSTIANILKPAKLTFESFGADTRWTYLRLEAAPIEPTGIERALDREGMSEYLTEVKPGVYESYDAWDSGELRGRPLPSSARPVTRYMKGSFVFFSTGSVYNRISATYDARHDKMSEDQFREYIRRKAMAASNNP